MVRGQRRGCFATTRRAGVSPPVLAAPAHGGLKPALRMIMVQQQEDRDRVRDSEGCGVGDFTHHGARPVQEVGAERLRSPGVRWVPSTHPTLALFLVVPV